LATKNLEAANINQLEQHDENSDKKISKEEFDNFVDKVYKNKDSEAAKQAVLKYNNLSNKTLSNLNEVFNKKLDYWNFIRFKDVIDTGASNIWFNKSILMWLLDWETKWDYVNWKTVPMSIENRLSVVNSTNHSWIWQFSDDTLDTLERNYWSKNFSKAEYKNSLSWSDLEKRFDTQLKYVLKNLEFVKREWEKW